MKTCPVCSTEFEDDLGFCRNEGTPLGQKTAVRLCPRCGQEVEGDKKFCRHCGAGVESTQPMFIGAGISANPAQEQSEGIASEVDSDIQVAERLISQGNFQEAISNLEKILKENPNNNEARLMHLLACVKVYNIYGYEKQIKSIKELSKLTEKERGLAREIFLLAAEETGKTGKEEEAREYRRLATRVILGQISPEVPSEVKLETPVVPTKKVGTTPQWRISSDEPDSRKVRAPTIPSRTITSRTQARQRTSRLLISFVLVFGLAAVLVAGMLGYYAKQKGVNIQDIFNGSSVPQPPVTMPSDTQAIAQVIGAKELGFKILDTGAVDINRQEPLISGRIESQLTSLRQLYAEEVQQKPELMGSMTLQLTISPSGEVTKVQEFASRIKDKEFKKLVMDEAYKWRFPEAGSGLVKVNYPLLFVPSGMDVGTLIKWEQVAGPKEPEPDESKKASPIREGRKLIEPPVTSSSASGTGGSYRPPPPEPPADVMKLIPYEVLYPTSVYSEPREDSPRVARIEAGTKVNVASVREDWLEVRSKQGRLPGFIKKDSAAPWRNR